MFCNASFTTQLLYKSNGFLTFFDQKKLFSPFFRQLTLNFSFFSYVDGCFLKTFSSIFFLPKKQLCIMGGVVHSIFD